MPPAPRTGTLRAFLSPVREALVYSSLNLGWGSVPGGGGWGLPGKTLRPESWPTQETLASLSNGLWPESRLQPAGCQAVRPQSAGRAAVGQQTRLSSRRSAAALGPFLLAVRLNQGGWDCAHGKGKKRILGPLEAILFT